MLQVFIWNRQTGVTGGLNHNKRQDISKLNRSHYHLQKRGFSIHEYWEKYVGFKKNIKKHGLIFCYNIRADNLLGIGYVYVRLIHFSCYACLSKMYSPWNISQDKYNQDQYKSENQNCVYWPILGSYNNWKIVHCIDSRKQHKSTNTDT